jgi:nucleotide-binding universal stress UspA family protein
MSTFLIPVDGSDFSMRAIDYVIDRVMQNPSEHRVHVLNVQMSLIGVNVKLFVSAESLAEFYREEGEKILASALNKLKNANVSAVPHIGVGEASQVIIDFARDLQATEIVMGSHGRGAFAGALMGSVAQKVIYLSDIPVVLIK